MSRKSRRIVKKNIPVKTAFPVNIALMIVAMSAWTIKPTRSSHQNAVIVKNWT